jgi:protein-S-isoprenylcysteine O-methyltransferase Ste14
MSRIVFMVFGAAAYLIFFATFLYLVMFVGNLPFVWRTVDFGGPVSSPAIAAMIDAALILIFAVQHSSMARPGFKAWWTQHVPAPIERSLYVLFSSLALILLFAAWRPIAGIVWAVENPVAVGFFWILFACGWLIVLLSTFMISHFELFGLTQVWSNLHGRIIAAPVFRQPLFYRFVRHPLYTGFFIAFWATPVMTLGHLLLATGMSVFMLTAIRFEEHDLIDIFGEEYVAYRRNTGMLMPRVTRGRR